MQKINSVFIIDDDKIYTYVLSKQFKNLGYTKALTTFNHGAEALTALKAILELDADLPDIILLDINMPVMDGWQFLDAISGLQFSRPVTIHMVSSSIDTADYEKAATYKAVTNFYNKPISQKHLGEILEL
ncbi:MAG: response regulator [Bacteroidota bacterium]